MIQSMSMASSQSISPAWVSYTNFLGGCSIGSTSSFNNFDVVPKDCLVRNTFVRIGTAPGLGKSWLFEFLVEGVPTGAAFTIADTETIGSYPTTMAFSQHSLVQLRITPTGSPTVTGIIRSGYDIETPGSATCLFMGGSGYQGVADSYNGVFCLQPTFNQNFYLGVQSVSPVAGVLTGYTIRLRGYIFPFRNYFYDFYVYVNDIRDDSTHLHMEFPLFPPGKDDDVGSVECSVTIARGDRVYVKAERTAGYARQIAMGVVFESGTPYKFPYCGLSDQIPTSHDYAPIHDPGLVPWGGSDASPPAAGREANEVVNGPFGLSDMIVLISDPPGSGKSLTLITQQNDVDQDLAVTLSDADVDAEDVVHAVGLSTGDLFNLRKVESAGIATIESVIWGFLQDATEINAGAGGITGDIPVQGVIGPLMVHHFPRETP